MNQSQRGPNRMVAAKNETAGTAAKYRLHAAPVRLDPRCARIVKAPSMHRAPEIRVQFEVGTAPVTAHCAKDQLEMLLSFWIRAVQRVPRTTTPAAERHPVRSQR